MANDVFANGRELSCKAGSGKTICAFPDVCFTPPENPATPPGVPIPYPNTGMASDTTSGSKTVKISGKEVMLKNKSYFKKSTGDEAGCAAKKGVVTSVNRGKVYFTSWSMDIKFEGENVVRHMDLTTHNHASEPPQTPPWMHVDEMAIEVRAACADEIDAAEGACRGKTPSNCGSACKKAQKCLLVKKGNDKESCCKPHTTGHHMIEDHWVTRADGSARPGFGGYNYDEAPTVCANTFRKKGTVHRRLHDIQGTFEESYMPGGSRHNADAPNGGWNYGAGKEAALTAHGEVFKGSNCRKECLEAQLDAYYGDDDSRTLDSPSKQGLGSRREDMEKKFPAPARFP
jgi:hypothetical protein